MSAGDGSERGGISSNASDQKAEEEERYRLKIVVLQEYYDAIALQTIRIRERIYQVKKQCRRLEAMKRVALNMLHQNTGTYEIPPLEIVDEDPSPSFLESIHKQQHTSPDASRKKSKRPSRSKSDGKLTPEEEERAKQKICSIIDSVYSETAKRMSDAPGKSVRNANTLTQPSQAVADALKGSQRLFDSEHKATEESGKQGTSDVETPNSACDDIQPGTSSVQISEHSEILHDEEINAEEAAVISYPDVNSLELGYESSMTAEHRLSMNAFAVSAQSIVFPAMTSSLYGGVVAFNEHTGQAQNLDISLTGSVFDPSLDAVQPMSYSTEEITTGSTPYIGDSAGQTIDCCLLQEGIENSSNYHSASVSSVSLNYNENLNPQAVIGYVDLNPVVVQQLNYPAVTTPGSVSHLDKAVIRGDEAATKSPTEVRSPVVVGEVLELAQQSEGKHESTDTNKQADTRKSSNDGLPPPNFIPYRMITVENSKPTEIITTDPSSDVSTSKPPPKRRRKYKYVVESVLDNVPYTFRQAESDDDESSEKPNAITK